MLISRNLHMKSSEVSIKTRSTPASLSFKGQATKHTTAKWSIQTWGGEFATNVKNSDRLVFEDLGFLFAICMYPQIGCKQKCHWIRDR